MAIFVRLRLLLSALSSSVRGGKSRSMRPLPWWPPSLLLEEEVAALLLAVEAAGTPPPSFSSDGIAVLVGMCVGGQKAR